eukprot:6489827-Amphidinium_carterae.1
MNEYKKFDLAELRLLLKQDLQTLDNSGTSSPIGNHYSKDLGYYLHEPRLQGILENVKQQTTLICDETCADSRRAEGGLSDIVVTYEENKQMNHYQHFQLWTNLTDGQQRKASARKTTTKNVNCTIGAKKLQKESLTNSSRLQRDKTTADSRRGELRPRTTNTETTIIKDHETNLDFIKAFTTWHDEIYHCEEETKPLDTQIKMTVLLNRLRGAVRDHLSFTTDLQDQDYEKSIKTVKEYYWNVYSDNEQGDLIAFKGKYYK